MPSRLPDFHSSICFHKVPILRHGHRPYDFPIAEVVVEGPEGGFGSWGKFFAGDGGR